MSEHDAICEEIHHFILELFDTEEVMLEVSHIIVAVSMPEGIFNENDAKELKALISLERLSNWRLTPLVTTIVSDNSHGRTASQLCGGVKIM